MIDRSGPIPLHNQNSVHGFGDAVPATPGSSSPIPDSDAAVTNPGSAAVDGEARPPCPQLLYTPGEAGELLAVKESWLRRQAGLRAIPCTLLGKHLRFSRADLEEIAAAGHRPGGTRPRRSGRRTHRPHRL
ncbi:hypothetical protein SAMN05216266_12870 [Amycolatopsis marina]|uniref:Helix-turn-helix domain-containing protein n=1 Tax=Amycolatopsis marina TaxID=490629 RepID=A0A1I1CM26_9PSEU|nr:helix-turn-helix domain-containing protein [Amycolatopsis marina]SFB61690.1 hypothetical protein SAMN05216266_12870 [Amycolatopsis marina]